MNLRKYLEQLGLKAGATDAEIKAFHLTLSGEARQRADALAAQEAGSAAPGQVAQQTLAQPAPQAVPAGASTEDQTRLALANERQRVTAILGLAHQHGLPQGWADGLISRGETLAQAQASALEHLSRQAGPVRGLGVTGGDDGRNSMAEAVEDALVMLLGGRIPDTQQAAAGSDMPPVALRADGRLKFREPSRRAAEIRHLGIQGVIRTYLSGLGINTVSLSAAQLFQAVSRREVLAGYLGGIALSHSTSDFPGLLGNALNKVLLPIYEETPATSSAIAVERQVNDLREVKFHSVGRVSALQRIYEGGEYVMGTLGEKYEKATCIKMGIGLALTLEMLINDDLGAFQSSVQGFASASRYAEEDYLWALVTANAAMNEDGVALFHANHNNLSKPAGTGVALSADSLAPMRAAMRTQKGIAPRSGETGPILNLMPNALIVPVALEPKAAGIVASLVRPGGTNNEPNYDFVRSLQVVSEPRLDANSSTAYYLAARNASAPAIIKMKLRGYETPYVERLPSGPTDNIAFKARHFLGGLIGDWRAWQKQAGA